MDQSGKVANVRILVERVIGRLRKFNITNRIIPLSEVDLIDNVMVVSGLVNLNCSIYINHQRQRKAIIKFE